MKRLLPWLLPISLLLVWQGASQLGWLHAEVLPAPSAVALAAWKLAMSGELWRNIRVSFARAAVGFLIGGGIGLALGLLNGISGLSEKLLDSSLQMLRTIPHLALIPLVILWFGIDEQAKLFLVALGVFFPVYVNTLHGVRSVDPQLMEMGRAYGMSERNSAGAGGAAGRAAVDLRRAALWAGHHVADLDCRRDDLVLLGASATWR